MNIEEKINQKITDMITAIRVLYEDQITILKEKEAKLMEETKIVSIAKERMREMDEKEKDLLTREAFMEKEKEMDRQRKAVLDAQSQEVDEKLLRAENILKSIKLQ